MYCKDMWRAKHLVLGKAQAMQSWVPSLKHKLL